MLWSFQIQYYVSSCSNVKQRYKTYYLPFCQNPVMSLERRRQQGNKNPVVKIFVKFYSWNNKVGANVLIEIHQQNENSPFFIQCCISEQA